MASSKKFFVSIDLQGNELQNTLIGANGDMSQAGSFQYDAANNRLEYFNGTLVEQVANLTDIAAVTGGLIFQGGYDPTTNTPDITVDDNSVKKGFFWVATVAGTFLGETVQVGDSIIAKQDNPGNTAANWLILQGNVVIATDSVDGIVRLATQTEVNTGTEGGAVVLTPATLQGKIDTQITPEINNKLPLSGGTMSGNLSLAGKNIEAVNILDANNTKTNTLSNNDDYDIDLKANLNAESLVTIVNLPAPTNDGDAANKTYVDTAAATAQSNAEATAAADATTKANAAQAAAEAYADSLAPNYDPAGAAATAESNANAYTDTEIAAQSYTATIAPGDWEPQEDGSSAATITHNLGSYVTFTAFYNGTTADFNGSYAANTLTLYCNNIPSANTVVNIVKAGGNL